MTSTGNVVDLPSVLKGIFIFESFQWRLLSVLQNSFTESGADALILIFTANS